MSTRHANRNQAIVKAGFANDEPLPITVDYAPFAVPQRLLKRIDLVTLRLFVALAEVIDEDFVGLRQ